VRSAYAKRELTAKDIETVEIIANDLKDKALVFYDDNIRGINVSDIIYPPNEVIIDEVVLNTITDIKRIKDFHPVEKPTFYKYAAYIGFWWLRGKPLLCKAHDYKYVEDKFTKEDFEFITDICKSVNEIFITDVMLDIIQMPPLGGSTLCIKSQTNDSTLVSYTDIKDSLCYFLRYRQYNAQELELFLKGLNVCPFSGIQHE
jgi:hypothetical protein